ncbi:amine oxidase [Talaromyces proteolyticus]|uniref:Amine oxidase n=1 Tax=Talaromyces proteolyticus TaxID=1131652 RepID=A0AAD4KV97_9EURO|nr:amine oxidase [Talaromyces proteolyticus]KAH8701862.1 amine oxidase [Talaromyces proteolyticus]
MILSNYLVLGLTSLHSYVIATADIEAPSTCRKTSVAILGGGAAGVAAGKALSNASITDFLIIEYQDDIGGRAKHTTFGKKSDGTPYVVELGANWVQGLGVSGGPQNPIWTMAQKYNLTNTYSNYSSILTYNETGFTDFSDLLDVYDNADTIMGDNSGEILLHNLQDQTARTGLSLAGWKPKQNMAAQAVEWWEWDWESAYSPEESSLVFGVAGNNVTFNYFSDANNFVFDQRGFSTIFKHEASAYLKPNDPRLLLRTQVTNISYSTDGVTIHNHDGSCIDAEYAICTFSLGVLQNDVVNFSPQLPDWKETAIQKFAMGTYTKIFLQFNETFWPEDTQYFLYASPTSRGYYPVWQSLSTPGFLPGSNIIFVTVVHRESYRVENQSDEETKGEVMAVLRQMFPNITVPDPIAFMYPRWTTTPWAHGSYSNWPPSTSLEMHENLRANVDRLWFAGEALSAEFFGFLHGAWFEGLDSGSSIAALLKNKTCDSSSGSSAKGCSIRKHYEVLHGPSPLADYGVLNGWPISSFIDNNSD